MPGIVGYDPTRTRELERAARRAADHLLRLPMGDDPLAAAAVSAARLVRLNIEDEWLPALARVSGSTAMLDFSDSSLHPLTARFPTGGDADDVGPPASNSLDSELNPSAGRTQPRPSEPITGAVLPNGWEYTCGPLSASTGQAASGCEWMPPTPWDMRVPLLVASVMPITGEVVDTYDCLVGDIPCEMIIVPFVSGRAAKAIDDVLTTGARAADATRTFDVSSVGSWARPDTLADHFERHGPLLGSRSAEHYVNQATTFLARAVTENLPTKIDPNSGKIRIWDPRTDRFAVYNPDGSTATFYVLEPEKYGFETSTDYWEDQPG